MVKQDKIDSLCFGVTNNVEITIMNSDTNEIRKNIKIHNKASRRMVTGLLRFMAGHFNASNCNDEAQYKNAKDYIPCYIGFGDGGIVYDASGKPSMEDITDKIPEIEEDWTQYVYYTSTKMNRELDIDARPRIKKVYNSFETKATADMDSLYYECVVAPGTVNGIRENGVYHKNENTDIFITELGLFPTNNPKSEDILAYVKLSNYEEEIEGESVLKTNTLYVRPQDTIIIRWIITIAAIGTDSKLTTEFREDNGTPIPNDVIMIPELVPVEIEEYPPVQ